jgi:hypothetical protein
MYKRWPTEERPLMSWLLPILRILQNAMYAGAYVFGKTEARTKAVGGRPQQASGHPKPQHQWTVLSVVSVPTKLTLEHRQLTYRTLLAPITILCCRRRLSEHW